ncbi:MAG: glycosyltransferase [Chloroflexi bacterium]|nr:glycosyltransferase [Chloroflexota bacterium]
MTSARRAVHLTTVHRADDPRIALKECASLSRAGWEVVLVHASTADPPGSAGVRSRRIRSGTGRIGRMTWTAARALRTALAERADVYHIHDPELIPVGLVLKARGRRVIYDVHEDLPRQIQYKPYLAARWRGPAGRGAELIEAVARYTFDAIVAATPAIGERFTGPRTAVVQNFPMLDELGGAIGPPYSDRAPHVVYVGRITPEIGAREMVLASQRCVTPGVRFTIAGPVAAELEDELSEANRDPLVSVPGRQDRDGVKELLGTARVGLVLFHPLGNYVAAYPTKMFEYMAAGLPVVASDFPLWRDIVERASCGLLVDPLDPAAIAGAVDWLLNHPADAAQMGANGRAAVLDRFNWESEERKLVALYDSLVERSR